ncbi:MAG: endonuclease/exonuclease/phosphatase family protein [Gloeobacteraceae cyanobacterium ES-bin-144]|nr:endonuclease/exonuclease/phosphatase family protein [Verrucomicrobiales bacterium]
MTSFRNRMGWSLVLTSLALHLITVFCFARQPDHFAAFTVLPIWIWGGGGLLLSSTAFYFLRAPLSLVMTAIWAVTLLVGSDEARVFANFSKSAPKPGPAAHHDGKPVLRVITCNCADFLFGDPSKDVAVWDPDIVLLQDIAPEQVRKIADTIYGGHGDYRYHNSNGIVTRWKILREVRNPLQRDQQITIAQPDGSSIEVVNVHLATAATDLRLWHRSAWKDHRNNRALRQKELALTLQILEQTADIPNTPTFFGGDFNSPASDVVHRQLDRDFEDAFSVAGTGWGDTFQRRLPILRIDHIYASRHFSPIRCSAVTTRHSDHRMVVADFLKR